jgi:hypothetical protein
MVLLDFGAPIDVKDDFDRKPYDEIMTNIQARGVKFSLYINKMLNEAL